MCASFKESNKNVMVIGCWAENYFKIKVLTTCILEMEKAYCSQRVQRMLDKVLQTYKKYICSKIGL